MTIVPSLPLPCPPATVGPPAARSEPRRGVRTPAPAVRAGDPDDEEQDEDLGDEEDLSVAQPPTEEDSAFDDFDDEFDDDFEEDQNDPDWDHPDDAEPEGPGPSKGGGRKN